MKTSNNFFEILSELKTLKENHNFVIEMRDTNKPGYGIANLQESLKAQVTIETVFDLGVIPTDEHNPDRIEVTLPCNIPGDSYEVIVSGEADFKPETKKRVRLVIFNIDNVDTLNTKIGYVKEKIALIEEEARKESELKSDHLFTFLKANLHNDGVEVEFKGSEELDS